MKHGRRAVLFILCIALMSATPTVNAQTLSSDVIIQHMPWPGILPTSPLYSFKSLRDKVLSSLISSGEKRLEYDLFASNKSFREMFMLYERGNHEAAYRSGLKAQNYITRFIVDYKWMRDDGYTSPVSEGAFIQTAENQKIVLAQMGDQYEQLLDFLTRNIEGLRALKETMQQ